MRGPLEARVVGVVRPLRYNGLTGDLLPELHVDYRARPLPQWLVVRTRASSDAVIPVLKATLRQADPITRITADPVTTFAATTMVVTAVALLACWVPAGRARSTDPLAVLRSE